MKRWTAVISLFLSLVGIHGAFADQPKTQKIILDNGLTVLLNQMPSSTTLAVYALVKTGSATEGPYMGTGISHFVEHMLFKGTTKRAVGEVSQEVKALGGEINASTSFDYTMYTIDLPAGQLDRAVDLISDMLMNSVFDAEQMEKERAVIFGEMRLYKDNPDRMLNELIFSNAYLRHPYRHPIIGDEELFAKISHDDILNYYHTTYIPNNMIISIAGAFDEDQVRDLVEKKFKDFVPKAYPDRNTPQEPEQIVGRQVEEEYPTELTRVSMSYQGVSSLDPDMIPLDVLAMILGQGESSRLYLDVYKAKGLVYSVSAGNFTPMDRGLFDVDVLLDEDKIGVAEEEIKSQISLIKQKGVDVKELEKAKRQVLSDNAFGRQTPGGVASEAEINYALLGDPDFAEKYLDAVNHVTSDDVKRVAQKYLIDSRLTVGIVKPKKKTAQKVSNETPSKEAPIEKITLKNGLVVLLREDHTFPLVTMNVALNGGTRQETAENNGLSQLTSSLWDKGTSTRSADQIAQEVESLGARLDGFSGRNSLGLSFSLLSGDVQYGLELLEDLVKNPAFPETEFAKNKELQKTSIRSRDDSIGSVTGKAMRETLFQKHSFRLEPLGTLESVEKIHREDVVNFYKKLAVSKNMVLTVFGDFKKDSLLPELEKRFSGLKDAQVQLVSQTEAPPDQLREKNMRMEKEQAMVMVGFQGPTINEADRYGMEMIASILGSSLNGRIFIKIRDELGKSYTLGGSYTPGIDAGLVTFYVSTTDENVEKVKDILLDQIEELQKTEITDEDLINTKTYLIGSFKMGMETNSSLSFMTSLDELYGLGFDYYKKFEEKVNAVTKADIKRLALKYLSRNKAAVVLTRPVEGYKPAVGVKPLPEGGPVDIEHLH